MATKKTIRKKSTATGTSKKGSGSKQPSATTKKKAGRKSGKSKSSEGILSKAKKVARKVLAGAAKGAVAGAAEAGSKATGIGQASKNDSQDKSKSAKRKSR